MIIVQIIQTVPFLLVIYFSVFIKQGINLVFCFKYGLNTMYTAYNKSHIICAFRSLERKFSNPHIKYFSNKIII